MFITVRDRYGYQTINLSNLDFIYTSEDYQSFTIVVMMTSKNQLILNYKSIQYRDEAYEELTDAIHEKTER